MAHLVRNALLGVLALAALAVALFLPYALGRVEDPTLAPELGEESAPALVRRRPAAERQVFFGDLHVHTSYSVDAFVFGVRSLPEDAYRFAKGHVIEHGAGYPIQLSRPLDFLAVTDHAEYLGTARAAQPDVPTVRRPLGEVLREGSRLDFTRFWIESVAALSDHSFVSGDTEFGSPDTAQAVESAAWKDIIAAAERHNDPGVFTAFIGYEWSSPGIHRNVVYGSGSAPDRPFSSIDSDRPQDLWVALEAQRAAGQPVIAIPHNGNESAGKMYPDEQIEGLAWTREEALRRRAIEPVSEIFQVKGSSETHPALSPDDAFADFEIVERLVPGAETGGPAGGFTRDALRTGLQLAMRDGWNPYVFGVIGSSDSHNASSPVEEDNHHGKLPVLDGSAGIRSGESLLLPNSRLPGGTWGGGGLAAVWAEENTRASLFAGLQRREAYGTSGPRIRVRFFGGWTFDESALQAPEPATIGYRNGVPMGGFLPERGAARAPRFLVLAAKDPSTAHLDRVQIVKGWVDEGGESHERVYDVVASDGRERDPATGSFPPVGSTVDVANATYTNAIGAAQLQAVWEDPDFDPSLDAFYYARILEIPTPRMSTYDAKALGIEAPEPATIQERATTSAIWYDASGRSASQLGS